MVLVSVILDLPLRIERAEHEESSSREKGAL